jgi:hypothetical protein
MSDFYTPYVGAFIHFDMPGCGYGIVVGRERVINEEGSAVIETHILWEGNQWSSIEDLKIPHGDPFWRVVLPQLPASTLMYARNVWRNLVLERKRRDDECDGCPELRLH